MTSAILSEIASKTQIEIADTADEAAVKRFLRQSVKTLTDKQIKTMTLTTRDFVHTVIKAVTSKTGCPLPPDLNDEALPEVPPEEIDLSAPKEEVEKFEGDDPETETEELSDRFKCKSDHSTYTTKTLLEFYTNGTFDMPDFQRNFIWSVKDQEDFIVSFMCNIPVPPIMVATVSLDEDEVRFIIDGCQRTNTLKAFLDNKITFQGKKFNDHSDLVKRRFLFQKMTVTEILADRKWWPLIFRKINKGGKPLSDIEIRRVAYRNRFMSMLQNLTQDHEIWIELYGKKNRFEGMGALLRALSMHMDYLEYEKPMTKHLDRFCEKTSLWVPQDIDLDELYKNLDRILWALHAIGKDIFRQGPKKPINSGMIDCVFHCGLVALDLNPKMTQQELTKLVTTAKTQLLNNPAAVRALTIDTSGRESVETRMGTIEKITRVYLNPPEDK